MNWLYCIVTRFSRLFTVAGFTDWNMTGTTSHLLSSHWHVTKPITTPICHHSRSLYAHALATALISCPHCALCSCLLCSKLCQPNRRSPTSDTCTRIVNQYLLIVLHSSMNSLSMLSYLPGWTWPMHPSPHWRELSCSRCESYTVGSSRRLSGCGRRLLPQLLITVPKV